MGKLIVIEGIDQSGKETQTRLLVDYLQSKNKTVSLYHFPDYNSIYGKEIKRMLYSGETNNFLFHILYEADRYEKMPEMTALLNKIDYIVCDRYSMSNVAYSVHRGIPLDYVLNFQKFQLKPDCTIVIDIPPKVALARKNKDRDKYESNLKFLEEVRSIYLSLVNHKDVVVVDGTKSIDDVYKNIVDIVENL